MGQGRCAAAGCGRFVRQGARWCARHAEEMDPAAGRSPPEPVADAEAERAERAAAFQERLARGDYRALLGPGAWAAIAEAGATSDLSGEIGVLRVVLARLLIEEEDPARLAQGAARVAGALVQAARAQRALSGSDAEGLAAAVARVLEEME